MKYLLVTAFLFLNGCSSIIEHESNIQVGQSSSYCNQLRMQCSAKQADIVGSNGQYSEWENRDGSIGSLATNNSLSLMSTLR